MTETLSFHIEEGSFRSTEGWQRQPSDLNESLSGYLDRLQDLRLSLENSDPHSQNQRNQLDGAQSLIRDLRLRLSISVAWITS